MIEHLLVYGTLAPGESNHYMMKDISGVWKTAYFKGIVLKKDWGKWNGYPGVILDNEANEIKGYVFSSKDLIPNDLRMSQPKEMTSASCSGLALPIASTPNW